MECEKKLHGQGQEPNLGALTSWLGTDPSTLKISSFDFEIFTVILLIGWLGGE